MPIGTTAALAIGLGAAGVGSAISAGSNRSAARTAAQTQQNVANQNNALAASMYAQNSANLAPYLARGNVGSEYFNGFYGLPQGDTGGARNAFRNFLENSDYGFQFGEGANRVNSGYAGAGTLQSGAAMKGLERFRQDLQAGYRGEFTNALANQQGVGLAAGSALAGVGGNYVNTVSANNQNAGDAAANAALIRGQNNPFANALGIIGGGAINYGLGR